jgi:hypothetical protein
LPSNGKSWFQDSKLSKYNDPDCDLLSRPEDCVTIFTNGNSFDGTFGGVGPASQLGGSLDGTVWKFYYIMNNQPDTPLYFKEFVKAGNGHSPIRLRTDASDASNFKVYMV